MYWRHQEDWRRDLYTDEGVYVGHVYLTVCDVWNVIPLGTSVYDKIATFENADDAMLCLLAYVLERQR